MVFIGANSNIIKGAGFYQPTGGVDITPYLLSKMTNIPSAQLSSFVTAINQAAASQPYTAFDIVDTLSLIDFIPTRNEDQTAYLKGRYDGGNGPASIGSTVGSFKSWNTAADYAHFSDSYESGFVFPTMSSSDGVRFNENVGNKDYGLIVGGIDKYKAEIILVAKFDLTSDQNSTIFHSGGSRVSWVSPDSVVSSWLPYFAIGSRVDFTPTALLTQYNILRFSYDHYLNKRYFQINNETIADNTSQYIEGYGNPSFHLGGLYAQMNIKFIGVLDEETFTSTQIEQVKRVISFLLGLGLY